MRSVRPSLLQFSGLLVAALWPLSLAHAENAGDQPVSYYKQIRPIFQAHCQGCHQPAKSSGAYVMTAAGGRFCTVNLCEKLALSVPSLMQSPTA